MSVKVAGGVKVSSVIIASNFNGAHLWNAYEPLKVGQLVSLDFIVVFL